MKTAKEEINKMDIMTGVHDNAIVISDKLANLYPITFRYLSRKIDGWSAADFFNEIGAKKIALYAVTDLTRLLIRDLDRCNKSIEFVLVDTNYMKYMHKVEGQQVHSVEELMRLYRDGQVEKIVSCSVFFTNEIITTLLGLGVRLEDIISINDVI